MNIIRTIDLWTEQNPNHIECFSGAFVDGFENGNITFNSYKMLKVIVIIVILLFQIFL